MSKPSGLFGSRAVSGETPDFAPPPRGEFAFSKPYLTIVQWASPGRKPMIE